MAVVLRHGRFAAAAAGRTIEALLAAAPDAPAVGADVPIGLPELGEARPADALLRAAGCAGISRRACALGPRIADVEDHVAGHPADARRVREAHPEVSFCAPAGAGIAPARGREARRPGGRRARRRRRLERRALAIRY